MRALFFIFFNNLFILISNCVFSFLVKPLYILFSISFKILLHCTLTLLPSIVTYTLFLFKLVSSVSLITDVSLDEWNRIMNTSVTGAFLYSKCVLPKMINKKQGRIINITSMWGIVGASCEVHYSTAKAALIGFTKALAKEVGPSGITVNAIAPGVVRTEMNSAFSEDDIKALCDETPVGRIAEPEEIAKAALYLASDDASFITGEVLNISGGFIT